MGHRYHAKGEMLDFCAAGEIGPVRQAVELPVGSILSG